MSSFSPTHAGRLHGPSLHSGHGSTRLPARRRLAQAACLTLSMGALAPALAQSDARTARQDPASPTSGAQAPAAQPSAASGQTAELPAVSVTSTSMSDGTSEGTGSYRANATRTATGLNLSPRETPQTITVISREQMDDEGMTSVNDALKATSGVAVVNYGMEGSQYYSRGFTMQYQIDGMAAPGGVGNRYSGGPPVDLGFIDRMEVLQGASGMMAGAGDPGGTVNLIRKRPTRTFQAHAEVSLGSWSSGRLLGDVSGPLVESGRIRGRLVAVAGNSDSFTNYAFVDRRGVYGIVEADLTSDLTVDASIMYQKDKGRYHLGVPLAPDGRDLHFPRSAFFADANSLDEKDITNFTLGLTYRLPAGWDIKAGYSRQHAMTEWKNYSYLDGTLDVATGRGLTLLHRPYFEWGKKSNVFDVRANGPLELFGRRHDLGFGLNGSIYRDENWGTDYARRPVDVYNFDPTNLEAIAPVGRMPGATPTDQKTTNVGLYGVARWNLADSLKLITGLRVSNFKQENVRTGRVQPKESGVVTPYAALVYDINSQYSTYVSYSEIFRGQTNRGVDGNLLDPVVGASYELGVKGELLDKRLNVSAALFRVEEKNRALVIDSIAPDPGNVCGGTCYAASGKVVSQGVDLGANGQLGRGWNVAANYTFVDAEHAVGPLKGQNFQPLQPRHSFRLATNYQVPNTPWSIGGNMVATSRVFVNNSAASQGSLVLLGLHAGYRISSKTQVSAVISNLTDRRYYALFSSRYAPYGEPRKFMVTLRHYF
ncbi:MAG: TonB-dependent siderophore receptor [Burkholderiaceae bacterium]